MEIKEFVLIDYEGNTEIFAKVEELNKLVTELGEFDDVTINEYYVEKDKMYFKGNFGFQWYYRQAMKDKEIQKALKILKAINFKEKNITKEDFINILEDNEIEFSY